jgi:hypothetical protein
MSSSKHRVHNTNTDNLISNLRGEVGDIIHTWMLLRKLIAGVASLQSDDLAEDLSNPELMLLHTLIDKLKDEIVARLSELAESKVGRLTFHFAREKLKCLDEEVEEYQRFIQKNRFHEKRNCDISHKELPEQWADHRFIDIPYRILVGGVARALRLMKKFDAVHLGPSARYLWKEMRTRRYGETIVASPRAAYLLLPYLWLSKEDRLKVLAEELTAGMDVWQDMTVRINGVETVLQTYGRWGFIKKDNQLVALDKEFLQITEIDGDLLSN